MNKPRGRWVYADGDDGQQPVLPRGNTRMYAVKLTNFRRDGRLRGGTATIRRLQALFVAIEKRHPDAVQSPPTKTPMQVRIKRGGPVVAMIWPLKTPMPAAVTKQ